MALLAVDLNKYTHLVHNSAIIIVQEITKLQKSDGPLPPERAYHAACCLGYGSEHPCILVTGGWANDGETLKDAWIYDFTSNRWDKVMHVLQQASAANRSLITLCTCARGELICCHHFHYCCYGRYKNRQILTSRNLSYILVKQKTDFSMLQIKHMAWSTSITNCVYLSAIVAMSVPYS